jgi:hypothetical protein
MSTLLLGFSFALVIGVDWLQRRERRTDGEP